MSLTKRGAIWYWRKMVDGHTVTRTTKTSDKRLAEQMAAKWEAEFLREVVVDGTKPVTVHQAIRAFMNARKGTGGYENVQTHMLWWQRLPNIPLKEVSLAQLQEIVAERMEKASHNTTCITIIYWNALINFAVKQGWTGGIKLPNKKRVRTRMRFLSYEEEARLLEAINPKQYKGKCEKNDIAHQANADLVVSLLHTGARYSEIAHMTWDQVDLEKRTVYIRRKKGGTDTVLAMSEKLYEVMARRKATVDSPYVFPSKIVTGNSYKWLEPALKAAKISDEGGRVTIHTLRHTYASRMLQAGLSIVEVQQLLGHRNLASTAVYLHTQQSIVAGRAAELLNKMR